MRIVAWDVIDVVAEKNGHTRTACFKCAKPAMWVQAGRRTQACSRHRPKSLTMTKAALTKKTIPELQDMGKTYGFTGKTKKDLVGRIWTEMNKSGWAKFKGNARAPGGGVLDLVNDIVGVFSAINAQTGGGTQTLRFLRTSWIGVCLQCRP